MSIDHSKLRELFIAACDLDESRQNALIEQHCADHPELKSELQRLLLQDASEKGIFVEGEVTDGVQLHLDTIVETEVPQQIGGYQIKKVLGEGGMGVVYLAEQDYPRRHVAVKVIRAGAMNRELASRFKRETNILGLLQHPGIAQIHEAGTATVSCFGGRQFSQPYIAMEFVNGLALVEYAARNGCSISQKLQLVVDVCEAVQTAHHRGVIHRDLKPANILVAANSQIKILDFGVARLIDPEQPASATSTNIGQVIGTLAYMSPEQLTGEPELVDTRSDVYSIGVILYELLCGETPHQFNQTSIPDAIQIKQHPPGKPSDRDARLHGDIETIVLKSLEADRVRRYQSPSDLAAEINRFLNHLPIEARPPSLSYHARKFARRHAVLVASLGVVAATFLAAGILVASFSYEQSIALAEANRQVQISREVNDFLNDDLLGKANPNIAGRSDLTVRTLLDQASDRIEGRFAGMPQVEAAIRFTIGRTYLGLGDYPKAEEHLTRSMDLYTSELGPESLQTINVGDKLALSQIFQWKLDSAETLCEVNLTNAMNGLGEANADTAACHGTYAILLKKRGRFADAESHYRKAIAIWDQSNDVKDRRRRNIMMNNLALVLNDQKKSDEAEDVLRDVLQEWRESTGKHPDVAFGIHTLASQLFEQSKRTDLPEELRQQKLAEASSLFDEALEWRIELLGELHPETAYTLYGIALIQKKNKEYEKAIETLNRVLELRREIYGTGQNLEILDTINGIGTTRNGMQEYDSAVEMFQQAFSAALELVGPDHYRTRMYLRNLMYTCRVYLKDDSAIQEFWDEYQDRLSTGASIEVLDALSLILAANSKLERAVEVTDDLCRYLEKSGASNEFLASSYDRLAKDLAALGQNAEADAAAAEARKYHDKLGVGSNAEPGN